MRNYWLLQITRHTLGRLPVSLGYLLARVVADIVFLLSPGWRRKVRSNLRRALGTEDRRRLTPLAREVFRNVARNYFDLIHLPRCSLASLERSVEVRGWHHFQQAFQAGRGVILVTAHLGNFDLVAQVMAAWGLRLTVMVEPVRPEPLHRVLTELRQSRGLHFLPAGPAALKQVIRELRSGGVVAMACDRDVRGNGLEVEFLGETARLPLVVVDLALRTGAALIPAFSIRQSRHRFIVYVEPPLPLAASGQDGHRLRQNAELLIPVVERYIRQYPGQWVVMHPVWPEGG